MSKVRLTIIGSGIAGHHFIENLLDKSDVANFDITVFYEKSRRTYDHVHLSFYFSRHTAEELSLVREGFHEKHDVKVLVGEHAIIINRREKIIHSSAGRTVYYDKLTMAMDSYPWTPPTKGSETQDCFVYRTTGDLNTTESCARRSKRSTIIGGGLLGLEATGALRNLGIETHVIEFVPMLMARQLDHIGNERLRRKVRSMGVRVYVSKNTKKIVQGGAEVRKIMRPADGNELEVNSTVFSTGTRPRDRLVTQYGLDIAPHGGIVISDAHQTFGPDIYAIGGCASWNNHIYGLVTLGCKITQAVVDHILETENTFRGASLSIKLKLLGVDVSDTGDTYARAPGARSYVYLDKGKKIHKRLIASEDNKTLFSAVLVSNTSDCGGLLQLVLNAIKLPRNLDSLILSTCAGSGKSSTGVDKLPDSTQICSCFDITEGMLVVATNKGYHIVTASKAGTETGTGCGGCIPLVTQVLSTELAKQGIEVNSSLYEHFSYPRQELFHLIRVEGIKTFEELLARHGKGYGCEVCKLTVGSLLAPYWNEYILKPQHTPLQDTNDDFLVNTQKDGTYSVVPCSAGGEITPEGLVAVGCITHELNLYTKTTSSQRIGLSGVWKDDSSEIQRQLIEAGSKTGHAYTKALRVAKTCVDNTWRRYGAGDSVGFDVELENRYRGIRTPYKMRLGVSGCTCECTEAQGKDVGTIATEKGWNLYVCGNGGTKPHHADLLAANINHETLFKYPDRLMMLYIRTVDKLTRTAPRLDNLEDGIECLKSVIIDDKLDLNQHLGEEMTRLREAVACE